jgi:outer membrane protein TolC
MKKTIIILFLLCIQISGFTQSLDEYLMIAAENNPELKAYFNEYLAAMEKVPQVGALPDPEVTLGFFIMPMERFMGTQKADIQLMQMFPWFGMLKSQKDEASKMAMTQYELYQNAKNNLFYEVKSTWYEMYRLKEEIRITEENLDIMRQYERLALIRFQSAGTGAGTNTVVMPTKPATNQNSITSSSGGMSGGMASGVTQAPSQNSTPMGSATPMGKSGSGMSDVLRVRIEIKSLENTLAFLKDSRLPLQALFNQLLSRDYDQEVVIIDTLINRSISLERIAILDSITTNNPMLRMLDAEVEAYEAQKTMAKLEGRPMLGAGINYMPFGPRTENGMSMGGNDMVMPMVRFSVPIYRKKYTALLKEAELKQLAVKQRRENTVNSLSTQWSGAMRNLDDAVRKIEFYNGQTELTKQTLNLIMTSYATDGRDFEEVLRVQQQLLNYQLSLITAVVNQQTTIAELEKLAAIKLN